MKKGKRAPGIVCALFLCMTFALMGCSAPVSQIEPTAAPTATVETVVTIELTSSSATPKEITVLAAASLSEAFTEMAQAFEQETGIAVVLSFAGSQECVAQILGGVKADVFASASNSYMEELIEKGFVSKDETKLFAANKLILVCSKKLTPAPVFAGLAEKKLLLVIADETVPVGKYTLAMLEKITKAGLLPGFAEKFLAQVVSKETNVKLVLKKVEMGEADCGIVYTSDAVSADMEAVYTIDIPDEYNVTASYPASVLQNSQNKKAAQQWMDYLTSDRGQVFLEKYGLLKPAR